MTPPIGLGNRPNVSLTRWPGTAARSLLLAFSLLALSACANMSANKPSEVRKTWDRAVVLIKDDTLGVISGRMGNPAIAWSMSKLEENRAKRPVVVYLHGCTGLYWNEGPSLFRDLAERGYVVVAPDSFARNYRPQQCGAQNRWTAAARFAEIRFAREQLRKLGWADQRYIFLAGGSEGGYYAGAYGGGDFKGRIIMSAPCWVGAGDMSNTLAVWSRRDPWMRGTNCARADRKVVLDSAEHNVLLLEETADAVRSFLQEQMAQGPS